MKRKKMWLYVSFLQVFESTGNLKNFINTSVPRNNHTIKTDIKSSKGNLNQNQYT